MIPGLLQTMSWQSFCLQSSTWCACGVLLSNTHYPAGNNSFYRKVIDLLDIGNWPSASVPRRELFLQYKIQKKFICSFSKNCCKLARVHRRNVGFACAFSGLTGFRSSTCVSTLFSLIGKFIDRRGSVTTEVRRNGHRKISESKQSTGKHTSHEDGRFGTTWLVRNPWHIVCSRCPSWVIESV